jgi:DNA-directed RNA polymerase specialized sigma24 family protein
VEPQDDSLALDPLTRKLIHSKVDRLVARCPFARPMREDLEEDLRSLVHLRTQNTRPQPGKERAFLGKLIDCCLIDFLRRACAAKRDYRHLTSLHRLVREEGGRQVELGETLPADAHERRLRKESLSEQEQLDLSSDVAEVLRGLPPGLRELAEQLLSLKPAEIVRLTGVPRSTLQGRIRKLRQIFENANLGKK